MCYEAIITKTATGESTLIFDPDNGNICTLHSLEPNYEESRAMITAAPDLLDACREFDGWTTAKDSATVCEIRLLAIVKQVRAAIAKATP